MDRGKTAFCACGHQIAGRCTRSNSATPVALADHTLESKFVAVLK
jgi:hypothetical protein